MQKRNGDISLIMMTIFMVMNFILSMSGTLFNGILDKIAIDMNISVAQTGYLTTLYAYGAVGAPVILILFRKTSQSSLLKGTLFFNILFGILSITTSHFSLLLFSRFMLGIVGTTYGVLATTSIATLSHHEKVGRNLALLITGGSVALMVGVPLCRTLIHYFSWQSIYFVLVLCMILGLLYFSFCLPKIEGEHSSPNYKAEWAYFKNKNVVMVLLSSFVTFVGYGAFYTYMTPYIVEMFPPLESMMSILLVLIGACSFFGNLLGGAVCDRIGFQKSLWLGSLIQATIGIIIFSTVHTMYVNLFFVLLWMMNGWFIGLQLNTGINIVTNRQSRLLVSINGSIIQFAQAVGATGASVVISHIGISWNIISSILASLVVLVILHRVKENASQKKIGA